MANSQRIGSFLKNSNFDTLVGYINNLGPILASLGVRTLNLVWSNFALEHFTYILSFVKN
jgi:hypothetical protein